MGGTVAVKGKKKVKGRSLPSNVKEEIVRFHGWLSEVWGEKGERQTERGRNLNLTWGSSSTARDRVSHMQGRGYVGACQGDTGTSSGGRGGGKKLGQRIGKHCGGGGEKDNSKKKFFSICWETNWGGGQMGGWKHCVP